MAEDNPLDEQWLAELDHLSFVERSKRGIGSLLTMAAGSAVAANMLPAANLAHTTTLALACGAAGLALLEMAEQTSLQIVQVRNAHLPHPGDFY